MGKVVGFEWVMKEIEEQLASPCPSGRGTAVTVLVYAVTSGSLRASAMVERIDLPDT